MNKNIEKTIKNLEKNNIHSIFIDNKEDVLNYLDRFIRDKDKVSVGGSITLFELGIIDYLRNRDIMFFDRYEEGLSSLALKEIFRNSFFSDVYLTSSNAITEDGYLYNVDGRGNRCAAMIYGPDKVLVIVGVNKIVRNVEEAIKRVEKFSAPLNARRINKKTPCVKTGVCSHCDSKEKICRDYVLIKNSIPNRIFVLIVNDNLGY
ncbi:lactate utilization protein [Mycoplasmatota bacterium]|nr:lactate utilization protein [Mycoplasmatota bacterium]